MGKKKKTGKLPYLQLYAQDWQAEKNLNFCSWDARYLWFEIMLLMHQAEPRGYLIRNGQPYSEDDLVKVISGASLQRVRDCMFELETNHVYSRDRNGVIYSRKMVKAERKKKTAQSNGKSGGNPTLKKSPPIQHGTENGTEKDPKLTNFGEIENLATHEEQKEIQPLVNQTLVYQRPETRDQRPEKKERKGVGAPSRARPPPSVSDPEIQMAFSLFNDTARRTGIPLAQSLHETRKKKLKLRLRDCGGLEGWKAALEKIEQSAFMRGANDRGWRADFDFILQEKSFTRLLEGFYDNQPTKGKQHGKSIAEQGRELVDSLGKSGVS
jgi:hypothetical protein